MSKETGYQNYIIIGTQREGTTTLFHYLSENQSVSNPAKKELHFFSENYEKGLSWYRNHFPIKRNRITGESTPYYLYHPLCAERISRDLPDVRLIVMLRNPVSRAYSNYWLQVNQGHEPLSFEEAIKAAEKRTAEEEKILRDGNYNSLPHRSYSYLARGLWASQLERYFKYFNKEKMLILKSEDFFHEPISIVMKTFDFLDLPTKDLKPIRQHNTIDYPKMNEETKQKLSEYFRPYNEKLYSLLGFDFQW
ncbi:MAG: sulfotransferase domain-containing protein [archaeon]|nr:sulfotransferase domain-containing protein [archaeon]